MPDRGGVAGLGKSAPRRSAIGACLWHVGFQGMKMRIETGILNKRSCHPNNLFAPTWHGVRGYQDQPSHKSKHYEQV
jgi:hypothetical protein